MRGPEQSSNKKGAHPQHDNWVQARIQHGRATTQLRENTLHQNRRRAAGSDRPQRRSELAREELHARPRARRQDAR